MIQFTISISLWLDHYLSATLKVLRDHRTLLEFHIVSKFSIII